MTDPGWVFLIQNAAGVVAEKGSLLSHTAIITRELRKPAVVGVEGAVGLLKTGDIVAIDGDSGTVRLLSRPEEDAV
jgi:pyruvate,water dikinase